MTRVIKWLIMLLAGFFVMSVVRMITTAFQKAMSGEDVASSRPAASPNGPGKVTQGGELKKCAACGVYNAAANSVTRVRGGETIYYCSTACREKAAAA